MKTKEEIRDWILENCTDEDGDIKLVGLNFGEAIIDLAGLRAGSIYNTDQKADEIYNTRQSAVHIHNYTQIAKKIDNSFQEAEKIFT